MLLFALLLPMILAMGAIVIGVGNWFVHAKNLQTKVDAAAFAGGTAWGFPCGADIDAEIEAQARLYVGAHTADDGTSVSSPHNPQVGGVGGDRIYVSLNQAQWWGGSFPASDFSDPTGPVCESKVLDVKATERDVSPLWKLIPLFPDVKRKARVQIEEVDGLTGLLPIAVRLPQPLSAAAVFYNESDATTPKAILDVKPLRQICIPSEPSCIVDAPPGLGQWTTLPKPGSGGTWAQFVVRPQTGVVIATSVRPACEDGPAPCLNTSASWKNQPIDSFCRQASGTVQCFDADGSGASQAVVEGVHLIRGFAGGSVPAGPNLPELRGAWLGPAGCPATGYFNSHTGPCGVELNVKLDVGSCLRGPGECFDDPSITPPEETRSAGTSPNNVEVRYCLVRRGQTGDVCEPQFDVDQDMNCGGTNTVDCFSILGKHPQIATSSRGNAFAIQVRLRNTTVDRFPACQLDEFSPSCRFYYTGAGYAGDSVRPLAEQILSEPIHRSFMGDIDRTGALEWIRLTVDIDCNPDTLDWIVGHNYATGDDAASQPELQRCYVVDLGMAGGLARDQDEPPVALNLGGVIEGHSQRALVDCDPNIQPDPKEEIVQGCQSISYAANRFDTTPTCPGNSGFFNVPKPDPFASWPPFRCLLTQPTASGNQIVQGFNLRLFGKSSSPDCPADVPIGDPTFEWGRNYWHRANNVNNDDITFAWDVDTPFDESDDWGNELHDSDPRLVTLFFTTYDSFTDNGSEVYPIVGFGNFYITGYGRTGPGGLQGGKPDDPCDDGNGSSEYEFTGNEPPPDFDYDRNTTWLWGHFVKDVTPAPFSTGGSGDLCKPEASFQPCVAVLVE